MLWDEYAFVLDGKAGALAAGCRGQPKRAARARRRRGTAAAVPDASLRRTTAQRARTLFVGIVPVGRREAYLGAASTAARRPLAGGPRAARNVRAGCARSTRASCCSRRGARAVEGDSSSLVKRRGPCGRELTAACATEGPGRPDALPRPTIANRSVAVPDTATRSSRCSWFILLDFADSCRSICRRLGRDRHDSRARSLARTAQALRLACGDAAMSARASDTGSGAGLRADPDAKLGSRVTPGDAPARETRGAHARDVTTPIAPVATDVGIARTALTAPSSTLRSTPNLPTTRLTGPQARRLAQLPVRVRRSLVRCAAAAARRPASRRRIRRLRCPRRSRHASTRSPICCRRRRWRR